MSIHDKTQVRVNEILNKYFNMGESDFQVVDGKVNLVGEKKVKSKLSKVQTMDKVE